MTQLCKWVELDLFNKDKGPPSFSSPFLILPPFTFISKYYSWMLGFLFAYFVWVKGQNLGLGMSEEPQQ